MRTSISSPPTIPPITHHPNWMIQFPNFPFVMITDPWKPRRLKFHICHEMKGWSSTAEAERKWKSPRSASNCLGEDRRALQTRVRQGLRKSKNRQNSDEPSETCSRYASIFPFEMSNVAPERRSRALGLLVLFSWLLHGRTTTSADL